MVRTNPRYGHMQSSPLVLAYSRPHLTAAANLPFELSRSPLNNLISLPMRHRYERRIGSIQGTPWVAPRQLQPVRYGYQGEAGLASNPVRWDRANSLASSTRIRTMSNLYPNSINSPRRSSAVLRTRTRVPEHYWSPRRRTMTNLNSNLIGSPGQTIRGSSVVLRTLAPEHYWTRGLPIPGRGRASGQTTSRRQARIFSEPLPGISIMLFKYFYVFFRYRQ